MNCSRCGKSVPAGSAYCSGCGASLAVDPAGPTLIDSIPRSAARSPSAPPTPSSSPAGTEGGHDFAPGEMLAGRYRISGRLGRGGMGEVYRADDLKLGQPVALKILPEALLRIRSALDRFHAEVRLARQVSHPNVCRVFDIGEADGVHFLTMEYIDGEDLATLLRRIGRLPEDKAVEIARQLCAGLAAAHDAGVLHRDLKPANVMIDGRGRARLTDFGLAALAEQIEGAEARSGTPAYMAPEQLAGREVTVRSDIFSLGLVLYELFTGQRAFEARSYDELARLYDERSPPSPTTLVRDLDPAIDRVILRCLDKDPRRRPGAVLQVAAALPGGDPLAAALAAGETPSPEMVAAAGQEEGLEPRAAWAWLVVFLVATAAMLVFFERVRIDHFTPLPRSPELLAESARQILTELGHVAPIADQTWGFGSRRQFLRFIHDNDPGNDRWDRHSEHLLEFWYRSSPRTLEAERLFGLHIGVPVPSVSDPSWTVSGMAAVSVDPRGRLRALRVVPEQIEDPAGTTREPDWEKLLHLAGLDPAQWTPVTPVRTPPDFADRRAAWEGQHPAAPYWPVRIEAAAYHGSPTSFVMVGPWMRPERMEAEVVPPAARVAQGIGIALLFIFLIAGVLLARRNLRAGRGDRKGAARLAAAVFTLSGITWFFGTHHVPTSWEVAQILIGLCWALFVTTFLWVLYVALEPYARRRWPAALISWNRLLAGRLRDPLVGRDILIGLTVGALINLLVPISWLALVWLGKAPPIPQHFELDSLLGARSAVAHSATLVTNHVFITLAILFLLVLLRALLRRPWRATAAFVILLVTINLLQSEYPVVTAPIVVMFSLMMVLTGTHYGVLALFALLVSSSFVYAFPFTTDFSAWYAGIGLAGVSLVLLVALYGFWTSVGGRPIFSAAVLED